MMACRLRRALESMATPCSVKAYGRYRRPPLFEVTFWHLKNSFGVNWSMKSSGNLSLFRLTWQVRNHWTASLPAGRQASGGEGLEFPCPPKGACPHLTHLTPDKLSQKWDRKRVFPIAIFIDNSCIAKNAKHLIYMTGTKRLFHNLLR